MVIFSSLETTGDWGRKSSKGIIYHNCGLRKKIAMAHKVVALFMCLVLVANAAVPDTMVTDFYKTCIKNCLDDCLPNKNNNHSLCDKLCNEGCVAIEKDGKIQFMGWIGYIYIYIVTC